MKGHEAAGVKINKQGGTPPTKVAVPPSLLREIITQG